MNRLRKVAVGALTIGLMACQGAGGPEDHGAWDGASCGDRAEACMWRGTVGASKQLSSSVRDSRFANDHWNNTDDTINDDVRHVENTFSTLEVRAYREYTYWNQAGANPTSCVAPGTYRGPYTQTSPHGLSSLKSC